MLVATVTVVFDAADEVVGGTPEQVAAGLLELPDVVTVRIGRRGQPSVYRVDVEPCVDVRERASAPASAVAARLGLRHEVRAVTARPDANRRGPDDEPAG